jgi:hypothetical protein
MEKKFTTGDGPRELQEQKGIGRHDETLGASESFSGNDEHELLNNSEEQKMKEKYIDEVSKMEDAPGNGGETIDEQTKEAGGRTNDNDY